MPYAYIEDEGPRVLTHQSERWTASGMFPNTNLSPWPSVTEQARLG